jgi:hypothetical protein
MSATNKSKESLGSGNASPFRVTLIRPVSTIRSSSW